MRARLYAANVVRDERALEDGAIELLVELPAAALAGWAAQTGVRLLEAQPLPAVVGEAPEPYLDSVAEPVAAILRC
jgi:hypothetical protein